ncbi:MAG TPA: hypothetical protein VGG74_02450 [Kofleriaceae bacterium]|jgi:hypothetical protein
MKLRLLVLVSLFAALVAALVAAPSFADRADPPATQAAPPAHVRMPLPVPQQPPQPTPPPPEVGAMAKQLAGSYACKGVWFASDGSSRPLVAKLAVKTALAGGWIETSLVESGTAGVSIEDFRTFDPVAQQWLRIALESTGASTRWTSVGEKNGSWTWDGTTTSPQGTIQARDHEQLANRAIKSWGEALLGGGWQKSYELTCTH